MRLNSILQYTAASVGASFAITKNLSLGADVWYLMATEDVTNKVGTGTTDKLGTEVDVKINWKLADNVTWGWSLGWLMPDDGLGDDDTMGAQGILSMKF
jgi:long-subunit fatty acid transport protein